MAMDIEDRSARLPAAPRGWRTGSLTVLLIVGMSALSGCSVWRQARRTLIQEPSEYSAKLDRGRSLKAYRQMADEVWAAEARAIPEMAADEDYALGFRDGFVDFVYAGGDGEPPPVPPRRYWNIEWRNPPGKAAAQQWFAGYRHGANSARSGGYRQFGIVMSSGYCDGAGSWGTPPSPFGDAPTQPLGPAGELIPIPPAPTTYDDGQLPEPPSPATAAPEPLPTASPTEASPLPEFAPAEPAAPASGEPASSAVQKFRRAVSTVHFLEPTSTP